MARFTENLLASSAGITEAVDEAIEDANLVDESAMTTAITTATSGLAEAADLTALATDVAGGAGRAMKVAPFNHTGTGAVAYTGVTMPTGMVIASGAKALVRGVVLVRQQSSGVPIAKKTINSAVLMHTIYGAWDSGTAAANNYDTGARVTNEGHGWESTVDNNVIEPTVAVHTGWTDLGAGAVDDWSLIGQVDAVNNLEAGASTYFADESGLPGIGTNVTGALSLAYTVENGEDVRMEADLTITDCGVN